MIPIQGEQLAPNTGPFFTPGPGQMANQAAMAAAARVERGQHAKKQQKEKEDEDFMKSLKELKTPFIRDHERYTEMKDAYVDAVVDNKVSGGSASNPRLAQMHSDVNDFALYSAQTQKIVEELNKNNKPKEYDQDFFTQGVADLLSVDDPFLRMEMYQKRMDGKGYYRPELVSYGKLWAESEKTIKDVVRKKATGNKFNKQTTESLTEEDAYQEIKKVTQTAEGYDVLERGLFEDNPRYQLPNVNENITQFNKMPWEEDVSSFDVTPESIKEFVAKGEQEGIPMPELIAEAGDRLDRARAKEISFSNVVEIGGLLGHQARKTDPPPSYTVFPGNGLVSANTPDGRKDYKYSIKFNDVKFGAAPGVKTTEGDYNISDGDLIHFVAAPESSNKGYWIVSDKKPSAGDWGSFKKTLSKGDQELINKIEAGNKNLSIEEVTDEIIAKAFSTDVEKEEFASIMKRFGDTKSGYSEKTIPFEYGKVLFSNYIAEAEAIMQEAMQNYTPTNGGGPVNKAINWITGGKKAATPNNSQGQKKPGELN